jgi:endonuclease YncB( thermonuclease family)
MMRRSRLLPAGLVVVLGIVGGVMLYRVAPPPRVAAIATPPSPAAPGGTAGAGTSTPPADTLPSTSDLPTIAVPPRAVHAVPEDDSPPPKPVTLLGRDGRDITPRTPPRVAAPIPPPTAPAAIISGAARVSDGVSLTVLGRPVQLFGVRPPQKSDRCAVGKGAARPCAEVAREALAGRLKTNAVISCRVPPGQSRPISAAVCVDATGADLAGFLVAEGFALADVGQSYDYVGAEGVARSFRRGLWRYR